MINKARKPNCFLALLLTSLLFPKKSGKALRDEELEQNLIVG